MKRSIFLVISAILVFFIGVMCLFFPEKMAAGFGMTVTPLVLMMIKEAGACNVGIGYLNFAVRNHPDSNSLKVILLFNMVYHILILPANIYGWSQGIFAASQVGTSVGIHLLFAVGFLIYALKVKTAPQG